MTHDELLAKFDELERFSEWTHYLGDNRYAQSIPHTQQVMLKALRAVVEIHKPMLWKNLGNDTQGYFCQHCDSLSNEDAYRINYPCPTIQTIEKELK